MTQQDPWADLQRAVKNLVLVIRKELQIDRLVKWLARRIDND